MGLLSGVVGAVGSIAGSLLGAHSARENANQANKVTLDLAKNGMQYRVNDLRKAGLNPILAVNGSGGLGSVSSSGIQAAQPADFSGAVNSAVSVFDALTKRQQQRAAEEGIKSQIELQRTQIANSAADVRLKMAQADQAIQSADNMKAQSNLINQQVLTEASRRANIESQTGLNSASQIRTHYQTMQDKVIYDYLHTDAGKASTVGSYDAKSGGIPALGNYIFGAGARFFGDKNSAKAVNKGGRLPPNQFQQQLINNYRR